MADRPLTEKERMIEKVYVRLHRNDKLLFKKLLGDDNLSYQDFFEACYQAFLRADPNIVKVVKDWRIMNEIPKDELDKYTLSLRERRMLINELEQNSPLKE